MRIFKKISSFLLTFVILFSLTSVNASAKEELKVSKYATNKKIESVEKDGKIFYKGKFTAKIPLAKVIESYRDLMLKAKDNNGYPHGKDGKNKIAYIDYNLKFPKNVHVDEIKTNSTSNIIPKTTISSTLDKDNNINFKFKLTDQNWKGVYEAFLLDMKDPLNHTVDVFVYYSFEIEKENLEQMKKEKIKGSGDFSFYPKGIWAKMKLFLQVYKTDDLNISVYEN